MPERSRLAQRRPGTHLHPALKNRAAGAAAVDYPYGSSSADRPDLALLTRLARGLRDLDNGSP